MKAHVVENNLFDALDLIVAQVEGMTAFGCGLCASHIVIEKADTSCFIQRPGGWLLDVVVQRREK